MFKSVAGIIHKDNKYFLGKRKPGGAIGGKWEFPGGKVEDGESFADALKREYLEELNVNIIVKEFITIKYFKHGNKNFSLHAYYVELENYNIDYNEHEEFKWFTKKDLIDLKDELAHSDSLLLVELS